LPDQATTSDQSLEHPCAIRLTEWFRTVCGKNVSGFFRNPSLRQVYYR
jgi:hypothetical protein